MKCELGGEGGGEVCIYILLLACVVVLRSAPFLMYDFD